MLATFSAIFGFLAPFLPELVKLLHRRQEHRHELELLALRAKSAQQAHLWRLEEISARADIEESKLILQPAPSFGAQILDGGARAGMSSLVLVPVFYLFALLDLVSALVRPTVSYAAFALYAAVKWAQYQMFFLLSSDLTVAEALLKIWREEDLAILTLCLSYWFGHRAAKQAFGGSASNAAPSR